jgi:hypothetical protein
MGSQPKIKNGTKNQSFIYVIVEANPSVKPFAEYFMKLWLPTPVATIDIAINHQAKRLPPKKKSVVVRLYLPKYEPKAIIAIK